MNNQSKSSTANYYDKFSERQEAVGVNKRHISIANKITERKIQRASKVLEIGCGIGTLTSLLFDLVPDGKITAADLSPKSIEIAKNKYRTIKNVEFIAGDATEYPFNGPYDLIVLPDVLEHIPFELHHKLFVHLESLLNENGRILIHIPNPYHSDWWRAQDLPMQIIDLSVHLPIIINNLKNTGLHITYLEIYGVWQNEGEYQFIELQRESKYSTFTQKNEGKSFLQKLKEKLNFEIGKLKNNKPS